MMHGNPSALLLLAARMRRVGRRYVFGHELETAQRTHWAMQWHPGWYIAALQWKQVRECVTYACETSEFYRKRFSALGLGGELTPDTFRRIPPLTRDDVIFSWESIHTLKKPYMIRRSGGSSGQSIEIALDRGTYCWYIAGTWRGLQWWGSDLLDRGAIILGSGGRGLGRLAIYAKDWLMNWLRLPVDAQFDRKAPAMLERIARFGPAFIYGYPSAVHRLARIIHDRGWRSCGRLKVIVLTGEPVYAFQRESIEHAFQCPAVEEYGNGELGSMAFQCAERTLHVTAENVFLETAPSGLLGDGVGGPILATQLRNRLFPLIRYETGDSGAVGVEPCRCGRGLPSVRVVGRVEDRLLNDHEAIPARPRIEQFLGVLPDRLQGRVQVAHNAPGQIVLRVERVPGALDDLDRITALGAAAFGMGWNVEAVETERLARLPSGKLPYFIGPKGGGHA